MKQSSRNYPPSRRHRSSVAVTSTFALALVVAACGGAGGTGVITPDATDSGAEVDDFGLAAEVLEAAREEGEVSYVGSTLAAGEEEIQAILRDEYGIELTLTPLRAAEALERLRTEQRAGNRTVDVVGLGVQYGALMKEEGLSEAFMPEGFPAFFVDGAEYDDDGYWYPFQLNLYGIAVNRKVIDPTVVSGWDSLVDGSITDPVVLADPYVGSAGFTWSVAMQQEEDYGANYLTRLGGRDNLQLGPVHADNVARVARGDVAGYFPFGTFSLAELQGSAAEDVELVFPGDEPYVGPINLSLTDGAPHPNAAQVLISLLMSERGQTLIAEGGSTPVRGDVEAPEHRFDLSNYEDVIETNLSAVLATHDDIETFSRRYFRDGR